MESVKEDFPKNDDGARDPSYFGYYAQFVHQQNMLSDIVRTQSYQRAILSNAQKHFKNKQVMDVGAGSGILSYFAVQAGAEKVYAIEASNMAKKIKKLILSNEKNLWLHDKIEVFQEKIERPLNIPKVDTIISEPIGVLLIHERMLESYLHARDHYLNPGGIMIPSTGTIFLAPFSDAGLWSQTMNKVRFWEQDNFYGVDFSPLAEDAKSEIFGQPIVGYFDYRLLMAPSVSYMVDFQTISSSQLKDFTIPIDWKFPFTGLVHGIAGWFDIDLGGVILSTAPSAERTHWQQVRFLFQEPLAVNAYENIHGWMRLIVNDNRSYHIYAEVTKNSNSLSEPSECLNNFQNLNLKRLEVENFRRGIWNLHEQTYHYETSPMDLSRPEFNGMYQPVMEIDS